MTRPSTRTKNGGAKKEPAQRPKSRRHPATPVTVAFIGAAATIGAALVSGLTGSSAGPPAPSHTRLAAARSTGSGRQSPASADPAPQPLPSPTPRMATPLIAGDNSAFVKDLTFPDGSRVTPGQHFLKKWEIKNIGNVRWAGRYLIPSGPATGMCAYPGRVRVPLTDPGRTAVIEVPVTAAAAPGLCFVTWKMATAAGTLYFPNEIGIWFSVKVTAGPASPRA